MSKNTHKTHDSPLQNKPKVEYYPDGKIKSKVPYVDGKKHGLERRWNEKGVIYSKTTWVDGKKHGLLTYRHENGDKYWVETLREGERHGLKRWWWESGKQELQVTENNGERQGVQTWWWERGGKQQEDYCLRDEVYARIEWSPEGNVNEVKFPTRGIPATPQTKPTPKKIKK